MSETAVTETINIVPVQGIFTEDHQLVTLIGPAGTPFSASSGGSYDNVTITDSTFDGGSIGETTPVTNAVIDNIALATGTISSTPSTSDDIVNKAYVDSAVQGLQLLQPAAVATTANITLSGLQAIDGYTTLANDRVLVKNQSSAQFNGVYVAAAGAWSRSTDTNTYLELQNIYLFVTNGTVNAGTAWGTTNHGTGTIDVTPINWVQTQNTQIYTAGTGLTLAANQFSITNTGVTAATKGSDSKTVTAAVNAQGQLTSLTDQDIAIAASQITSGTIDSARVSGSYTGITGVGTVATGTWNATTIAVSYGGTGATTLTGYVKGSGTSAFTASSTIPNTDISGLGTMSTQNANNVTITGGSISGLSSPLGVASGGTGAATLTGYVYGNGTGTMTASATIPSTAITGLGTMSTQNANNVSITGGSITGTTLTSDTVSNNLAFTPVTAPTHAEGLVFYDSAAHTLNYYNENSQMSVNIAQEQIVRVRNQTGATINNGQVVYISGATGQTPLITKAIATSYTTADVIGVTTTDISDNGFGYVTVSGIVNGLNTSAFSDGAPVYLSAATAGALTATEPTAPNYSIQIGVITYSNNSNGKLLVAIQTKSTEVQHLIGTVPIASGGTNGTATPTAGAIPYGTGTAYGFSAAGTSGQVLVSGGTSSPTWANQVAYATVTDDTTTNATRYPLFAAVTTGNLTAEYTSSTKFAFNPSTGALTTTSLTPTNALGVTYGGTGVTTSTGSGSNVLSTTPTLTNPTVTNYVETPYSANSSTAITLDLANGTVQIITLTGSPTITMPTAVSGKSFIMYMKTGSGSYTVTWSTVKWAGGTAPTVTSTASKMDIYSFFSDGTNWYGVTVGQNYTP